MNSAEPEPGAKPVRITGRCLLLVEGRDEVLFFDALVKSELAAHASEYQVIALGRDGFRRELQAIAIEIRAGVVESLGVVRDADEHSDRALQSVGDALGATGFTKPRSHGAIVGANPRVGVFVMPDGQSPGALEALCRRSVEESLAGSCVDQYLDCLRDRDSWGSEANVAQSDKAFAHAYLASRKNPVARVGEGAQQGAWDFGHAAFQPVTEFLRQLIGGPSGDAVPEQE